METKSILIVDDEQDNLTMFSHVLAHEQYSVVTALSGAESLKIVREVTPDLVLLDVKMAEMDGFETIKHLRSIKKLKHTPMIFLTGNGKAPKAIEEGYSLGGTEYWTKPISPEELTVRVRAVLRAADAEKKLRKLQQSFYSMVVHDLRNPLGAILGLSELMLEEKGSLSAQQMEIVTEINAASAALLKSVKDLLELSRFESGEYILHRKEVNLNNLIDAAVVAHDLMRIQKNITITVECEESIQLCVDEEYLREVFDNLLDNALRYTPVNGMIQWNVQRRPKGNPASKESISIEIKDTGTGISPEAMPTLFDKIRITNTKLRKADSRTGLGLVICREILEAHGGMISIESTPGNGTRVTIVLPA
ncbi:MAG: hybrid sensor histidine kinase/response regulator [Bacteroidota bacterium]